MSLKISNNIVGYGQPIFFLHGVGSRKHSWNQVIEELKNNYKCITANTHTVMHAYRHICKERGTCELLQVPSSEWNRVLP